MARIAVMVGAAACLALAACCAVLMSDRRVAGGVDLLAKLPQESGQKFQLAMFLKQQLNDQVKDQEKNLFDSTLKREGIADALKKDGFQVPGSAQKNAVAPSKARQIQHRLRSISSSRRAASGQSDLPQDVKLAQSILGNSPAAKSVSSSEADIPRSKLVLSTVIEAKSSRAGRKQAKVDAYLNKNVKEADAITKLAKERNTLTPRHSMKTSLEIARAAEMMGSLGDTLGPKPRRSHAKATESSGDEDMIEMALRKKLDAVVKHREHRMFVRSMSDKVTDMRTSAGPVAQSLQIVSQGAAPAAAAPQQGAQAHTAHHGQQAVSRLQIEHALKSKLDDITQSLEQQDLYKTELRRPAADQGSARAPPLSQSTFGGLNIKRSTEQSLEQELRAQLNSNVQSQEQSIFRSEAKTMLH